MLELLSYNIKWNARLAAKFFWAAPFATSSILFFTLLSQLSILFAFFLPLKVIILLGSEGMPRYFPPAFQSVNRDDLIIALSLATLVFYIAYLISEKIILLVGEKGAKKIIQRGRKIVLFENQDEVASNAYKRHANIMASSVFLVVAVAVVFILYEMVAWIALIYFLAVALLVFSACILSDSFNHYFLTNLSTWLDVLSSFGFMLAFGYMVIDFINFNPPGLISALVALLLSRQLFKRIPVVFVGLYSQFSNKAKLEPLFFHQSTFNPRLIQVKETFWSLLESGKREDWISKVLKEIANEKSLAGLSVKWWQTDTQNIAVLYCRLPDRATYFVKLFDHKRSSYAIHEATLLAEKIQGLPSLEWIGVSDVQGYHCHVLRVPENLSICRPKSVTAIDSFRSSLLDVKVPKRLVNTYKRSRACLWERISYELLDRLKIIASLDEPVKNENLSSLYEELDDLKSQLSKADLQIITRDIQKNNLLECKDGRVYLLNWGGWVLEPEGSAWPTSSKKIKQLEPADEAPDILFEKRKLAALTYEFERLFVRQKYQSALDLVKSILDLSRLNRF